jgi:hypothetical protein
MQPQQYTTSSSSPSPRHHHNTTTIRYAADAGMRTLISTDQDLHCAQSAIIDAAYREINQCIKHHLDRCLLAIKVVAYVNDDNDDRDDLEFIFIECLQTTTIWLSSANVLIANRSRNIESR